MQCLNKSFLILLIFNLKVTCYQSPHSVGHILCVVKYIKWTLIVRSVRICAVHSVGKRDGRMMQRFLLLFFGVPPITWGLRLHSYFTPGMMLQRDVSTKVWGYDLVGDVQADLICTLEGKVVKHNLPTINSSSTAGVWEAELPAQVAATVCDLQASSETEDIVLNDIMFGDIWLCSGQSNMEQGMWAIINETEEIAASASFTTIRYTVVQNAISDIEDPDADVPLEQPWADPTDDELWGMSAVCFLYARSLQQMWRAAGQEPVPLGLVDSDWGGTRVEAWSSPQVLEGCNVQPECPESSPENCDSVLYNAMIHPLARLAVKGFLWYQGESNGKWNRDLYNCTFPAMIDSWRTLFSTNSNTAPDAPFGFVQLASWRPDTLDAGFPVIRWHLTADYGYVPNDRLKNVFMASPLDTYDDMEGYPGGIHPRYKQIVGERLAVSGMYVAYGKNQETEPYRPYGPMPSQVDVDPVRQIITVTYDEGIVYDNTEISGFYVCQDDLDSCDSTDSLESWVEVARDAVTLVDSKTLSISLELPSNLFSLAYAWRETPVKRYLGLPVYGEEQSFSLPSPPWKKACARQPLICL